MELASLVFSCTDNDLDSLLRTTEALDEADCHPFAYDDIKHIAKTVTSRKKLTRRLIKNGFVPDLDSYQSTIAGCCSWGRKSLEWSVEKRRLFEKYLSKDFFELHPKYLPIRRWITQKNTPELFRDFVQYEEMRVNVLALIHLLDQLEGR